MFEGGGSLSEVAIPIAVGNWGLVFEVLVALSEITIAGVLGGRRELALKDLYSDKAFRGADANWRLVAESVFPARGGR